VVEEPRVRGPTHQALSRDILTRMEPVPEFWQGLYCPYIQFDFRELLKMQGGRIYPTGCFPNRRHRFGEEDRRYDRANYTTRNKEDPGVKEYFDRLDGHLAQWEIPQGPGLGVDISPEFLQDHEVKGWGG
jgi:hypothetical protein